MQTATSRVVTTGWHPARPVSYTHLDVYKRQSPETAMRLFATLLLISASSGAFAAQPQALHCERLFDARSGKVLGLSLIHI